MSKSVSGNHLGGYETTNTTYTFTGKPLIIQHIHTISKNGTQVGTQTEIYTYSYDHAERVTKTQYALNGNIVTLATNTYDNLGRLLTKSPHGSSINKLTYTYNLRDWLTEIKSAKFTQNLYYNTGNNTACYNGNISSMTWKSGTESATRGYKFTYDNLNRMKNAVYGEGATISANAGRFSENITGYDRNGNITSLQRYGKSSGTAYGIIDNLTIAYIGNQLKYANDAATDPLYNGAFNFVNGSNSTGNEYIFDRNGNLQQDYNKKISKIQYNQLNLPSTLQCTNGNRADYLYGADGVKRRVTHKTAIANISVPMGQIKELTSGQVSQTHTTDYCGNVIYENGNLSKILTEEGFVTVSGTTLTYHYYLKDHQGNNRVVLHQNGTTVEQVNHYYPFGGLFGEGAATSSQAYKYNGKELDRMHGLDWYDYGVRMYDAALGRFHTNDRFAEKYYSMSTYQYGANNPIRNVDVNGDSLVVLHLTTGEHLGMLIQDNSEQWKYYSFNGDKIYNSTEGSMGGGPEDNKGERSWSSPQAFLDDSYNQSTSKEDLENGEVNGYGYQEGYMIPTSEEQDKIVREAFLATIDQGYSLIKNQCSMAVQKALNAAGLKTQVNYAYSPMGAPALYSSNAQYNPYLPSVAYRTIVANNPNGIYFKKR